MSNDTSVNFDEERIFENVGGYNTDLRGTRFSVLDKCKKFGL